MSNTRVSTGSTLFAQERGDDEEPKNTEWKKKEKPGLEVLPYFVWSAVNELFCMNIFELRN